MRLPAILFAAFLVASWTRQPGVGAVADVNPSGGTNATEARPPTPASFLPGDEHGDEHGDEDGPHFYFFKNRTAHRLEDSHPQARRPVAELLNGTEPICVYLDEEGNCLYMDPPAVARERLRNMSAPPHGRILAAGHMPNVQTLMSGGNRRYYSPTCKNPPVKLNPYDHDYLHSPHLQPVRSPRATAEAARKTAGPSREQRRAQEQEGARYEVQKEGGRFALHSPETLVRAKRLSREGRAQRRAAPSAATKPAATLRTHMSTGQGPSRRAAPPPAATLRTHMSTGQGPSSGGGAGARSSSSGGQAAKRFSSLEGRRMGARARGSSAFGTTGGVRAAAGRRLLDKKKESKGEKPAKVKPLKARPPGWSNMHPDRADYDLIHRVVQNRRGFCPYKVRQCVVPDQEGVYSARVKGTRFDCCRPEDEKCCKANRDSSCCQRSCCFGRKRRILKAPVVPYAEWKQLPSVSAGWWGSCAYIGLGDNILQHARGREIDDHDLVIRLGHAPVDGFQDYVGSRTDVVVARGATTRMEKSMQPKDFKFYVGDLAKEHVAESVAEERLLRMHEVDGPPIVPGDEGAGIGPRELPFALYRAMADPFEGKARDPTTGMSFANFMIFSGFCKRIDLYGFSADGGSVYYRPGGVRMKMHHSCELESWYFHLLMHRYERELGMCVHL